MLGGVLILNEVVNFAKKYKNLCMIVSVNFKNTYACVSWYYLRHVMSRVRDAHGWFLSITNP